MCGASVAGEGVGREDEAVEEAGRRAGPGRRPRGRSRYARRVDPKTRNRIMAAVLVLMFVVVAVGAALGG